MFRQFLLCCKVAQLCICIYTCIHTHILFLIASSVTFHHKGLAMAPCAIQQDFTCLVHFLLTARLGALGERDCCK